MAIVQLFFNIHLLDAAGNVIQLDPNTITPNFLDCISSTTSFKDLSRQLMGILDAHLAEKDRKSRDFILRVAELPPINHVLTRYFIDTYFPSLSLSKILGSLKSTFDFLSWTPPPLSTDKYYQLHLRNTYDNAVDQMLEKHETKQAVVQRKCGIDGQQDTLEDLFAIIGFLSICSYHGFI